MNNPKDWHSSLIDRLRHIKGIMIIDEQKFKDPQIFEGFLSRITCL